MLLNYLTEYESAQVIALFGLGAWVMALIVMWKLNKRWRQEDLNRVNEREWKESVADKELERKEVALRLNDEMQEHEHKRKSEWYVLTERPTLIERAEHSTTEPRKGKRNG